MEGNKVEAHGRADTCKWIVGRSKPTHCHIPQLLVGKGDVRWNNGHPFLYCVTHISTCKAIITLAVEISFFYFICHSILCLLLLLL